MDATGGLVVVVDGEDGAATAARLEDALAVTCRVVGGVPEARSLLDGRRLDCVVTELAGATSTDGDCPGDVAERTDARLEAVRRADPTLPAVVYTDADLAARACGTLVGATAVVRKDAPAAPATLTEWVRRAVDARRDDGRALVAGVAHDLRNPLQAARLYLDAAARECESDSLDDLAAVHRYVESLVDDVETLARAGEEVTDPEPVDLPAAAREAWTVIDTDAVTLRVDADRTVGADRRRLCRLFENLFANAVEHGAATVVVGETPDGFAVADDGPGVPEADRERAFDRGYSGTDDGTGYGLAIVADVVDAHGWAVDLRESEWGGARFEVRVD